MKKMKNFFIWLMIMSFLPVSFVNAPKAYAATSSQVEFAQTKVSQLESQAKYELGIVLSESVSDEVTVNYAVTGGTATKDEDFELEDGQVKFAVSETSKKIELKVLDDQLFEDEETIEITLSNPVDAELGTKTVFTYTILDDEITAVTTNPSVPDGQNNWFISVPSITLIPSASVTKTFYQWNGQVVGEWQDYNLVTPVAPQGENILYYFSVDSEGNKENVRFAIFKVDTAKPIKPILTGFVGDDGHVYLSWKAQANFSYKIWRGTNIYKITDNSFIDANVVRGQTYTYKIRAIDQAGNQSAAASLTLEVPNLQVTQEAEVDEPVVQPLVSHVVKPTVAGRISTKAATSTVGSTDEPASNSEVTKEEIKESETGPVKIDEDEEVQTDGQNRLFVAISILVIAAGAAIAGYYGYEWWINRRQETAPEKKNKKSNSRW